MNSINIIGTSRSGLSILGAMLDCPMASKVRDGSYLSKAFDKDKIFPEDISLLSISNEHWRKYEYGILDGLLLLRDTPWVWMTRDPVVSVCSYVHNFGMAVSEAFKYWYDVNVMLWYFYSMTENRVLLKLEEVLLDPASTRRAFKLADIEFSPQFIRYGDFDHEYPSVPNLPVGHPVLEKIDTYPKTQEVQDFWRQYMNKPLIRWLGYHRLNID